MPLMKYYIGLDVILYLLALLLHGFKNY